MFWLITYYRHTHKHTFLHMYTDTRTSTNTRTHTYAHFTYTCTHYAESPGGCAVAECWISVCTRVSARVRVRAKRYTPRAESASPPPMGVPVRSSCGACAQVGAPSTPPTATHTHRTPFGTTPSRPVRSESASVPDLLRYTPTRAHTPLFLFFVFFFFLSNFILFPFVSRRFLSTHATNLTASPIARTR